MGQSKKTKLGSKSHQNPKKLNQLRCYVWLIGLLIIGGCGPCGKSDELELPTNYAKKASETSDQMAKHIPAKTDAVVFVASIGALCDNLSPIKSWLGAEVEAEAILTQVERQFGLNPPDPKSWHKVGFSLLNPLAIGTNPQGTFVVVEVEDPQEVEKFLEKMLKGTAGKVTKKTEQINGKDVIRFQKKDTDLLLYSVVSKTAFIVPGEELLNNKNPLVIMETLLSLTEENSLVKVKTYQILRDKIGKTRPIFLFSKNGGVLTSPLSGVISQVPGISSEKIIRNLNKSVTSIAAGVEINEKSFHLDTFAMMPKNRGQLTLKTIKAVTSPAEMTPLVGEDASGFARFSYNPRAVYEQLIASMPPQNRANWKELTGSTTFKMMLDIEADIIDKLSGHGIVVFYDIFKKHLVQYFESKEPMALLDGIGATLYVEFIDEKTIPWIMDKLNLISAMIPEFKLTVEKQGELRIAKFHPPEGGEITFVVSGKYLALVTGQNRLKKVLSLLSKEGKTIKGKLTSESAVNLLAGKPPVGLYITFEQILKIIAVRYPSVQEQFRLLLGSMKDGLFTMSFAEDGMKGNLTIRLEK